MPECEGLIRSADKHSTTDIKDAVKLRMETNPYGALPPISVPALFEKTVRDFPESPALSFINESAEWQTLTYSQYKSKVYQVAKAFIKLGLQPREAVNVLAFNCPEWYYSQFAAIFAGGIIAGIYTTNSPDAVFHIVNTSNAKILVVDDSKQMKKVREIWSRVPNLKAVVQIHGPFETDLNASDGYYKWTDIEEMDTTGLEGLLEERLNNIAVNECCMLIYTSGTVGFPKAAMLSHDNITWQTLIVEEAYPNVIKGQETSLTYLPMSHIAAQIVDVFMPIRYAGHVYFADSNALKGTLIKSLAKARPTRFLGVPRVYEKIFEQLTKKEAQLSILKKALLNWARSITLRHHKNRMEGKGSDSLTYKLAQYLVLNKIKVNLGLDKMRLALIGGAPSTVELKEYFLSLDIRLTEVYGMSETTGAMSMSNSSVPNLQTAGRSLSGISTKIHDPDSSGSGEVCTRSRVNFMGYLNDPEKTREIIDEDGWLHTGDLGRIDDKGYLYVTGRLKELIVTAGGENIPPLHIEELVKNELPFISNALLVGDKRKYLVILLTFKTEMDPTTGAPKDNLLPDVVEWLRGLDLPYTKVSEILKAGPCPVVNKSIEEGIVKANVHAQSNAQKVQKFALLPHDFSLATEELGPTLKLKRSFVEGKYQDIIETLYKS